jgi:hypothetical protein
MLKGAMTQAYPKKPSETYKVDEVEYRYTATEIRARNKEFKKKELEHSNVKQVLHTHPHTLMSLFDLHTIIHTPIHVQALDAWTLTPQAQAKIEKIGAVLGAGETAWVKNDMRIFTKTFKMKAVDWLNMSRGAGTTMLPPFRLAC